MPRTAVVHARGATTPAPFRSLNACRPHRQRPQQCRRPQVVVRSAAADTTDATAELPEPEQPQPHEWGEAFELDWEGQRTEAHASEPEDLGFAALCSLILLLGVGIFSMTRPAVRPATAQYVTRQPNITLIVERDSSSARSEQEDGRTTTGASSAAPDTSRSRGAQEEDSQDFLQTADDIRPMPDMHASLEQQLAPAGPSAFPLRAPHHLDHPYTDSEDIPIASTSQLAPPQPYPLPDTSTSYTAFPDEPYPDPTSRPRPDGPTASTPRQFDPDNPRPSQSGADEDRPPAYLITNPAEPLPNLSHLFDPSPDPLQDLTAPLAAAQAPLPTPRPTMSAPTADPPLDPPFTSTTSGVPLPQLEAEQPSHAVEPAEVQQLSADTSLQNMRERVQIAMRASAAASEASHRASAYSAAASSAASKAAEAAERATVAASALQRALEERSEDAISSAEARMARALELAGDAESRAASAAALATAYQDIAQTQASVAEQVSTVPAKASTAGAPAGATEAATAAKSSQLPFLQGLQGQWRLARFQLQHALEHVTQGGAAVASAVARFVTTHIVQPLLGVWTWLVSQF